MNVKFLKKLFVFCALLLVHFCNLFANNLLMVVPLPQHVDDTVPLANTVPLADSLLMDSTFYDERGNKKQKKAPLEDPVIYSARDSMPMDTEKQRMYLYGEAKIQYQEIELTAAYIEVDMATNTIYATGVVDSTGKKIGRPIFVDKGKEFKADTMHYNFETKKGFIKTLITEEEGGFLHSQTTKRLPDETICIKDGKYTTCNHEHPHFYIHLSKAKVIPNDKIVSGWANLVIADIPTPIGIPFGFFPNQKKYTSGILFPEYGEEDNRGFFFRDGGYYFAFSQYFDMALTGSIFSKGTWGTKLHSNYKKRYRYGGDFDLAYTKNVVGEKDFPNYSTSKDFRIIWNHRQDAKANPTSSFNAQVNMSSTSYDQNQTVSNNNYLQNTKSSSISYSKRWGSDVNMSANFRHSQNSLNNSVNLTLPSVKLNVARQYPFRSKNKVGSDMKWYENIEVKYDASLENRVDAGDSVVFTNKVFDLMENGFKHNIPVSANFKFLKFFTFTPSMGYTGRLYTQSIRRFWNDSLMASDSTYGDVQTDTLRELSYEHEFAPSASVSFAPTLYGMYQVKGNRRVKAIRHVLTPSVRFSYKPDMGPDDPDIWRPVVLGPDSLSETSTYSIYEGSIYGSPTSKARSGVFSFSLGNNLEMKMRSRNDTVDEDVKVKILESLSFSSGYDIYKEENKLSNITFSGRTTLFKKMNISFGGTIDPYTLDSTLTRTNTFEMRENGRIGRLTSANFSTGFSLKPPGTKEKSAAEAGLPGDYNMHYVDFNVPWSLSFDYSWRYSKPQDEKTVTQSLGFSGDFSLTPKWKVTFNSGYDLDADKFTYTTIRIIRDLHCWEASFQWVPLGTRRSYNFQINVKSAILQDLKWAKRKSWYDNF